MTNTHNSILAQVTAVVAQATAHVHIVVLYVDADENCDPNSILMPFSWDTLEDARNWVDHDNNELIREFARQGGAQVIIQPCEMLACNGKGRLKDGAATLDEMYDMGYDLSDEEHDYDCPCNTCIRD